MIKFHTCPPLPCNSGDRHQDSDQSPPPNTNLHSDSSSASSASSSSYSSSSLSSQTSHPSIPSLIPTSQTLDSTARHRCTATLRAHSAYVFSLAIAGDLLLSGSSTGEIRAWDRRYPLADSPQNYYICGTHSAVKSMAVINDGNLFTAHHDHKIRVWKIQFCNKSKIVSKKIDSKLIATLPTVRDRCMKLFSAINYVEIRRHRKCTWVHHMDAVSSLSLSKDGHFLYSVSWDRSMKVWSTRDFRCVESIQKAHDDAINAVVSSPDGLVFTGSADKLIKVWKRGDKGKHSPVGVLEKHRSAVNALALSEDGSVLYSGACDRSIIVWERTGGGSMVVAGKLGGHRKAILCLAVVGDLMCSGSADRTVRIWRRSESGDSYSSLAVFEGHKSPVKCLTACLDFNGDGKNNDGESGRSYLVCSGSLDYDIKVWQIWAPS